MADHSHRDKQGGDLEPDIGLVLQVLKRLQHGDKLA